MKNGRRQAKDLDEAAILAAIERLRWTPWPGGETDMMPRWVFFDELIRAVDSTIPFRLMLAKLSAMERNGEVRACFCGCRGDIELPDHDIATPPLTPPGPDDATPGRG